MAQKRITPMLSFWRALHKLRLRWILNKHWDKTSVIIGLKPTKDLYFDKRREAVYFNIWKCKKTENIYNQISGRQTLSQITWCFVDWEISWLGFRFKFTLSYACIAHHHQFGFKGLSNPIFQHYKHCHHVYFWFTTYMTLQRLFQSHLQGSVLIKHCKK